MDSGQFLPLQQSVGRGTKGVSLEDREYVEVYHNPHPAPTY